MAKFVPRQAIKTNTSSIEVTMDAANPLHSGRHRFQLIVEDDSGNVSEPATVDVVVIDNKKPTALLDAPATVVFGRSFSLLGARSFDMGRERLKVTAGCSSPDGPSW
ncbi:hypothetical protein [Methylophilus aquaticus]|uniref:Ig-like domain-containing protein n=1 Tax=Methylophilus aquaticus TaxID=1971610 RepID=A0ABT9JV81_9PROT|nr:hypothetical protein [Methylophilus aquaticus]MDP8568462.1 hypothetical protein [Methylophilus aquaticus]